MSLYLSFTLLISFRYFTDIFLIAALTISSDSCNVSIGETLCKSDNKDNLNTTTFLGFFVKRSSVTDSMSVFLTLAGTTNTIFPFDDGK